MNPPKTAGARRILGSFLAVGALLAGALAFATPAQASTNLGTFTYTGSSLTISGTVGDTFNLQTSAGGIYLVNGLSLTLKNNGGAQPACTDTGSNPRPCQVTVGMMTIFINSLGTVAIWSAAPGAGSNTGHTLTITAASGSSGGDAGAANPTPEPIVQQFGKPASGTCDAAAPSTLDWGGAGSGGWGESWAEWMHGGNGGAVCTRTLVYNSNLGTWTVG